MMRQQHASYKLTYKFLKCRPVANKFRTTRMEMHHTKGAPTGCEAYGLRKRKEEKGKRKERRTS
jgi:hypothetical protein